MLTNTQELAQQSKTEKEIALWCEDVKKTIKQRLVSAGVSKRFIDANKREIDAKTWQLCESFLFGESFYLTGSAGTGKTHLAVALLREKILINKPVVKHTEYDGETTIYDKVIYADPPQFFTVPELLMQIRGTFSPNASETEQGLIDKFSKVECLCLDDLGVEKTTDWSLQTLYCIIDRRYRDMKQTLFTSNLTLGEIAAKLGDRISSRITGMCKVVELKGADRRLEGK